MPRTKLSAPDRAFDAWLEMSESERELFGAMVQVHQKVMRRALAGNGVQPKRGRPAKRIGGGATEIRQEAAAAE